MFKGRCKVGQRCQADLQGSDSGGEKEGGNKRKAKQGCGAIDELGYEEGLNNGVSDIVDSCPAKVKRGR
ncbi:hypothetical protein K457DRAFT_1834656 [Linnemannia elongata AG-77]|uniref:Uncharacterized protein n=1 Tax=Linnemannia elongata AG-77 TaxID=1314771 RepID=A0A197JN59_9FUNG|nr:hypothetical protein K457DRAFT_1834656 [Linnemannia elongata AG-77]